MGFDFTLIVSVKSGQRNPSLAAHHRSSMVRDSVSITRERLVGESIIHNFDYFYKAKDENNQAVVSQN